MNAKSRSTGQHFAGLSGQDLCRFDANPGDDPLAGAPRPKTFAPAAPVEGQRSRINDTLHGGQPGENDAKHRGTGVNHTLGKAIFAEAMRHADGNTKQAYGVSTLPSAVTED